MKNLSRKDVLEHASNGTLLEVLCDLGTQILTGIESTIAAEIASAHNHGEIDLLGLFTAEAMAQHSGHSRYKVEGIFKTVLSELDVSADRLLSAIDTVLFAPDKAPIFPTEELSKWCRKRPSRVIELLEVVASGTSHATECIYIALTSGTQDQRLDLLDRAIQFLGGGSDAEKRGAASALPQLALDAPQDWQRVIAAFDKALESETDEIRSAVLRASFNRLKTAPESQNHALHALIAKGLSFTGDLMLQEYAYALAFNFEDIPIALAERILDSFENVTVKHGRTLSLLDLGLMRFIESGRSIQARSFLEKTLENQAESIGIEHFKSVRRKLLELKAQPLEDWTVAWLLSGKTRLCEALRHDFFDMDFDKHWFDIDFERFALTDKDYDYLGRKAIGVFFSKPKVMTSILVSLLRSAPPAPSTKLVSLLIDPVLVNYSGTVREYLLPIAGNLTDTAGPGAKEAVQGVDAYLSGLRAPGKISELHPSEHERQIEWQRHSDEMNEAMNEGRKNSLFGFLVSESILLHGSRSVTWVADLNQGPPRRLETPLANFGHSVEIPRESVVDPLGISYTLYLYRTEKRPE